MIVFLSSGAGYLYVHAVSMGMFALLEPRSFYDKIKRFSNNGICGLLGKTCFSTFHDKICGSCYNEKSVEN